MWEHLLNVALLIKTINHVNNKLILCWRKHNTETDQWAFLTISWAIRGLYQIWIWPFRTRLFSDDFLRSFLLGFRGLSLVDRPQTEFWRFWFVDVSVIRLQEVWLLVRQKERTRGLCISRGAELIRVTLALQGCGLAACCTGWFGYSNVWVRILPYKSL